MSNLLLRSKATGATTRKLLTALVLVTGMGLAAQASQSDVVIWRDDDARNIPEPKERSVGQIYSFFHTESENLKRGTDLPRWIRLIAGTPK